MYTNVYLPSHLLIYTHIYARTYRRVCRYRKTSAKESTILGSGTGIVGIATKLYCPSFEVVLSDLESNLDLIKKNAQTNGLSVTSDENDGSVSVVSIP